MSAKYHKFDPDGDLVLILMVSSGSELSLPATNLPDVPLAFKDGIPTSPVSEPKETRMLVSSKHLMLASPVFKAMLRAGAFREGAELQKKGNVEIPLPDDNAFAFEILLNIIHGRSSRILTSISLEVMTDITILVDKYQMLDVVQLYAGRIWLPPLLANAKLKSYTKETPLWLCISWIFQLGATFNEVTRTLQLNVNGVEGCISPEVTTRALPIPERLIKDIKSNRRSMIESAISILRGKIHALQSEDFVCTAGPPHYKSHPERKRACDGMMLGTLLKSLSEQKLWPFPNPAYAEFDHMSIKTFFDSIRTIRIYSLCGIEYENTNWAASKQSAHGMKDSLDQAIHSLESKKITGMNLDWEKSISGKGLDCFSIRSRPG